MAQQGGRAYVKELLERFEHKVESRVSALINELREGVNRSLAAQATSVGELIKIAFGASSHAIDANAGLADLLMQKGIITEDEYSRAIEVAHTARIEAEQLLAQQAAQEAAKQEAAKEPEVGAPAHLLTIEEMGTAEYPAEVQIFGG